MEECLCLVKSQPVGRIAFSQAGEIEIFPVNHCVIDDTIAFRTAEGSKLEAAAEAARVAFEVDSYTASTRDGWSVVVKGRAEFVTDRATLARLWASGLRPWVAAARPDWIVIRADEISGRRLTEVE
jgi:nitroimidazol reductase NimA-like FMN-containing flavoprotein (pyridoxamine 5'-phosphate oxidase superfamily)